MTKPCYLQGCLPESKEHGKNARWVVYFAYGDVNDNNDNNSARLQRSIIKRFRWLPAATRRRRFDYRLEGEQVNIPICMERKHNG